MHWFAFAEGIGSFSSTIYPSAANQFDSNERVAGLEHKGVDDTGGLLEQRQSNMGKPPTPDTRRPEINF